MATDLTHEPSLDDQPLKGAAVPEPARLRLRFPLGTIGAFMTLAIVDINGAGSSGFWWKRCRSIAGCRMSGCS